MTSDFTKNTALLTNENTQPCLHTRLGHPSNQTLKSMGLPIFKEDHCNVCVKGKRLKLLHRKPSATLGVHLVGGIRLQFPSPPDVKGMSEPELLRPTVYFVSSHQQRYSLVSHSKTIVFLAVLSNLYSQGTKHG